MEGEDYVGEGGHGEDFNGTKIGKIVFSSRIYNWFIFRISKTIDGVPSI